MRCRCGYDFARSRLDALRKHETAFESYAVVNNRHYTIFSRREVAVLSACDDSARLKAIAESSQYAGSLMECPRCARLLFLRPETNELVVYKPEA